MDLDKIYATRQTIDDATRIATGGTTRNISGIAIRRATWDATWNVTRHAIEDVTNVRYIISDSIGIIINEVIDEPG